jgi:hypothetical protein
MLSEVASRHFTPSSRWYDVCPHTKPTVELLFDFPKEVLAIVSEGMVNFAICKFNMEDRLKDSRHLGTKRVLALFQSLKKRRSPDACPHTHRVVNYLMVLDHEGRRVMVTHVLELAQHVRQYTDSCIEYQQAMNLADVDTITQTYVKSGNTAAHSVLQAIRKDFIQKVSTTHAAVKGAQVDQKMGLKTHTKIDHAQRDMKVQDD